MDKQAAKDLLYSGISELMQDRAYYYNSGMGYKYSEWTEVGKDVILEYISMMSDTIIAIEERALDVRAKELVINGLKGEKL